MLKITAADLADLPTRSEHTPAPTFPTTMAPMERYTTAQQHDAAVSALKTLRAYVAKAARWQIGCTRYSRGEGPQLPLSAMPSRTAGKQSYDKSAHLAAWLGWDREATRCHALVDQVRMVQAAEKILGR